jgi:hypothetical protein
VSDIIEKLRGNSPLLFDDRIAAAAEIERLRGLLLAEARGLINAHNAACQEACGVGNLEAVRCGYRPYFEKTGRRCTNCPTDYIIDAALKEGE